jgi:hypothetical protein
MEEDQLTFFAAKSSCCTAYPVCLVDVEHDFKQLAQTVLYFSETMPGQ